MPYHALRARRIGAELGLRFVVNATNEQIENDKSLGLSNTKTLELTRLEPPPPTDSKSPWSLGDYAPASASYNVAGVLNIGSTFAKWSLGDSNP
jgi:hypothetical protein